MYSLKEILCYPLDRIYLSHNAGKIFTHALEIIYGSQAHNVIFHRYSVEKNSVLLWGWDYSHRPSSTGYKGISIPLNAVRGYKKHFFYIRLTQ